MLTYSDSSDTSDLQYICTYYAIAPLTTRARNCEITEQYVVNTCQLAGTKGGL